MPVKSPAKKPQKKNTTAKTNAANKKTAKKQTSAQKKSSAKKITAKAKSASVKKSAVKKSSAKKNVPNKSSSKKKDVNKTAKKNTTNKPALKKKSTVKKSSTKNTSVKAKSVSAKSSSTKKKSTVQQKKVTTTPAKTSTIKKSASTKKKSVNTKSTTKPTTKKKTVQKSTAKKPTTQKSKIAPVVPPKKSASSRIVPTAPRVKLPDFPTTNWGNNLVIHFEIAEQLPPAHLTSIAGGIVFHEDKVLLANVPGRGWEIIGGRIDLDEDPEITFRRETEIQLGISMSHAKMLGLMRIEHVGPMPPNCPYPYPVAYGIQYIGILDEMLPFEGSVDSLGRSLITMDGLPEHYYGWNSYHEAVFKYAFDEYQKWRKKLKL